MPLSDDDFDAARAALLAAAFDGELWPDAMDWLRRAGGGWASQVVGFSPKRGMIFHKTAGLSEDLIASWMAYDAMDPAQNPRSRIAFKANSFHVYDDNDFSTEAERRRSPIYNDVYGPSDSPFVAGAKFDAIDDVLVAAFAIRSAGQGLPDGAAKAAMSALLPHLKASLRVQDVLENRASHLIAGTLENLDTCAILCRSDGRVVAATLAAERELASGGYLETRKHVLHAVHPGDDAALKAALGRAGQPPGKSIATTVLLRHGDLPPRLAEVVPLPRPNWAMNLGATVVVAMGRPRDNGSAAFLQAAFGLTDAEADITLRLAQGDSVRQIAELRQSSVATVRTQVKVILAKTYANSQGELIAKVTRFLARPL